MKPIKNILYLLCLLITVSGQGFFFTDDMINHPVIFAEAQDGNCVIFLVPTLLGGTQILDDIPVDQVAAIRDAFTEQNFGNVQKLLKPLVEAGNLQAIMAIQFMSGNWPINEQTDQLLAQNDPVTVLNKGASHLVKGERAEAIGCFKQASAFSLTQGIAHYMLGYLIWNGNDSESQRIAKEHYAKAGYENNIAEALFALGACTQDGEDKSAFEDDKKHLCALIAKEAEFKNRIVFPEALSRLGWIYYFKEHDAALAIPILHKAADEYNSAAACINLASLYIDNQDDNQAIKYYKKGITRFTELASLPNIHELYIARYVSRILESCEMLSGIYAQMGKHEEAEQYASKAEAIREYNQNLKHN